MKNFLILLLNLFLVQFIMNYEIETCKIVQPCKFCNKEELEKIKICSETNYYQIINCTDVKNSLKKSFLKEESCFVDVPCNTINSSITFFIFEVFYFF